MTNPFDTFDGLRNLFSWIRKRSERDDETGRELRTILGVLGLREKDDRDMDEPWWRNHEKDGK